MRKYRTTFLLILVLIFITVGIYISTSFNEDKSIVSQQTGELAEETESVHSFNVLQISKSEWNTPDGIPYIQVPGANLGATAFQILDKNRIAYLCNSTSEIIITDQSTGKAIDKFKVSVAPRNFVYENGKFYVLSGYKVTAYDEIGNELIKCPYPMSYQGIERLVRFNDATYLLLPAGNSLMIEDCGVSIEPVELKGVVTENGYFISSQITGNSSYSIKISTSVDNTMEKTYATDKKTAGVFIVGATEKRIFLDVQTFISENPVSVERTIISINLRENELGAVITEIVIPKSYYIIPSKDFYVSETGKVYNMMTSPQGVFIFSLTETKTGKVQGYPSF